MVTGRFALVLAIVLPLTAAGGFSGSAFAVEPVPGTKVGTDLNEIVMNLAQSGYTTLRYMNKDGRIEIVARKDGQRFFLLVDGASGVIVTVVPEGGDPLLEQPETPPADESTSRPAEKGHLSHVRPLPGAVSGHGLGGRELVSVPQRYCSIRAVTSRSRAPSLSPPNTTAMTCRPPRLAEAARL